MGDAQPAADTRPALRAIERFGGCSHGRMFRAVNTTAAKHGGNAATKTQWLFGTILFSRAKTHLRAFWKMLRARDLRALWDIQQCFPLPAFVPTAWMECVLIKRKKAPA